jgi:HK97 family phage prohead protease
VFNEIDLDGDVVLPSAFTDGQPVPMVWSHQWEQPIGKGVIRVQPDRAVFDGMFNLNTSWGRDAYESVKFQGDLQEYSWGFLPTATRRETHGDRSVRVIEASRVFEVSPVLVGANEHTGTLLVKSGQSFEAQIETALAAVLDVVERTRSLADLRAKEGRAISTARRERLSAFPPVLRDVAENIEGMLVETAPPEKGIAADAEVERFLLWSLRRNGVAV